MPKGIMRSEGSWSLIAAEGVFSDIEGNSKKNEFMPYRSLTFLVGKRRDP